MSSTVEWAAPGAVPVGSWPTVLVVVFCKGGDRSAWAIRQVSCKARTYHRVIVGERLIGKLVEERRRENAEGCTSDARERHQMGGKRTSERRHRCLLTLLADTVEGSLNVLVDGCRRMLNLCRSPSSRELLAGSDD
jgi:hypothetical protein